MFHFIIIAIILSVTAYADEHKPDCVGGTFPYLKFSTASSVEAGEKLAIELSGEEFTQVVFNAEDGLGKFELVDETLMSLYISHKGLRIVKAYWLAPLNYNGTVTLSAKVDSFEGHHTTCTIKKDVIVTNSLQTDCTGGGIPNLHVSIGRIVENGQKLDIEISADKFDHVTLRAEHWLGSFNFVEPNIPELTELKRGRALLTFPFETLKYAKAQWLPGANYKGTVTLLVTVSLYGKQFSSCTIRRDVVVKNDLIPDCVGAGIRNFNISVAKSVEAGQKLDIEINGDNFSDLTLRAYDEHKRLGSFHFTEPILSELTNSREGSSSVTAPFQPFKNVKAQWLAPPNYKGNVTLFARVSRFENSYVMCTLTRRILVKESLQPELRPTVVPLA